MGYTYLPVVYNTFEQEHDYQPIASFSHKPTVAVADGNGLTMTRYILSYCKLAVKGKSEDAWQVHIEFHAAWAHAAWALHADV